MPKALGKKNKRRYITRRQRSQREDSSNNSPVKQRPSVDVESLYRVNATEVKTPRLSALIKRCVDILGAIAGLVLSAPVSLLAALVIKISDGGPVFFKQARVGRNGRLFSIYKFRSMVLDADSMKVDLMKLNEHEDNRTFKILNDPRITRVGQIIRRLSIDEIPQFWNVLRGDMSLVGPRPALPAEVALYSKTDFDRLGVKPGITCIWQISGRSNLEFSDQLRLDLEYIQRQSLLTDIKILLLTVPAVVRGDGAA